MADSKFPLKLFLASILVACLGSPVFAEERQCAQCVSGNFLMRQWLMQHSASGQSMGWVDQWVGTDCAAGNLLIITCYHSCITVKLQRKSESGQLIDDGMMKDCADDLIHASPDLPEDVDYKVFYGNATYTATRLNYTITYEFTTQGFKSPEHVVQELATFKLPDKAAKTGLGTIIVLLAAVALLALAFIALCVKAIFEKKPEPCQYDFVHFVARPNPEQATDTQQAAEPSVPSNTNNSDVLIDLEEVADV